MRGVAAATIRLESRAKGVWPEWRLDKAQNFLVQRPAAFRIGKPGTHDLPGEPVHFGGGRYEPE